MTPDTCTRPTGTTLSLMAKDLQRAVTSPLNLPRTATGLALVLTTVSRRTYCLALTLLYPQPHHLRGLQPRRCAWRQPLLNCQPLLMLLHRTMLQHNVLMDVMAPSADQESTAGTWRSMPRTATLAPRLAAARASIGRTSCVITSGRDIELRLDSARAKQGILSWQTITDHAT